MQFQFFSVNLSRQICDIQSSELSGLSPKTVKSVEQINGHKNLISRGLLASLSELGQISDLYYMAKIQIFLYSALH